ncbi:MAG: UDP-N-acetylglucosamine 1-carboxyvinyltransferase [Candidatus Buchananbacteria bacterium]|nr:UDP-N-acetylglucosamine 1-carboxyvinyltransferase [Candidatus Buchananbacteria bacterium]
MSNYIINGGRKLKGSITSNGSKNAAVALLHATLLNYGTTTLINVPRIEEVFRIIEVLTSIGVDFKWAGKNKLVIKRPKKFSLKKINYQSAIKTRSVLFLFGALANFEKSFSIPQPGGCRLGSRTVMPHLFALENFGIKIKTSSKYYDVNASNLHPAANLVMYESGDTVTENAIIAASLITGKTVIKFASSNYMVQDLCYFLQALGVKIDGIGSTTLTIYGQSRLINKDITYTITEDPIESMLFLSIAVVTNSSITIKRCPIDFLELELLKLEKMGFKYKILKKYKAKNGFSNLVDIKTFPSRLKALTEKIYARPYPGLNIDNLPFFVPIATQAKGSTFIFDWVYEERALYYVELNKLGTNVRLIDSHRVYVDGPTKLKAAEIICPPSLRNSTIILVAMLAAKGQSLLRNIYSIERGYEDLTNRLSTIGADLRKID